MSLVKDISIAPMYLLKASVLAFSTCCMGLSWTDLGPTGVQAGVPESPVQYVQFEDFELSPGFQPDPQVGSGKSGGPEKTENCGEIDETPDHRLEIKNDFEFLRIWVESAGDVTLLVEKNNGDRWCSDDSNGVLPELAQPFSAGSYKIWVGDWGNSYDYTIRFSQRS